MLRSIAFRDHWTRTEKTFFDKGITMGSMEAYQDRLQRNIVFMISVRHTGEGDAMFNVYRDARLLQVRPDLAA